MNKSKKQKWALLVHPDFLNDKEITLLESPFVKLKEPVWLSLKNIAVVKKLKARKIKLK